GRDAAAALHARPGQRARRQGPDRIAQERPVGDAPRPRPEDEQARAARPRRVPGVAEEAVREGAVDGARREYYAPCTLGLERVVAAEAAALGGGDGTVRRGAGSCTGDRRVGSAGGRVLRGARRLPG